MVPVKSSNRDVLKGEGYIDLKLKIKITAKEREINIDIFFLNYLRLSC